MLTKIFVIVINKNKIILKKSLYLLINTSNQFYLMFRINIQFFNSNMYSIIKINTKDLLYKVQFWTLQKKLVCIRKEVSNKRLNNMCMIKLVNKLYFLKAPEVLT